MGWDGMGWGRFISLTGVDAIVSWQDERGKPGVGWRIQYNRTKTKESVSGVIHISSHPRPLLLPLHR